MVEVRGACNLPVDVVECFVPETETERRLQEAASDDLTKGFHVEFIFSTIYTGGFQCLLFLLYISAHVFFPP